MSGPARRDTVGAVTPAAGPLADLAADPAAWDRFVAGTEHGSYLQLSPWIDVKAANGWSGIRIATEAPAGPTGAQVLVRPARPLPWSFAYAPRGPVATGWSPASVEAISVSLRAELPRVVRRVSHLRIDPEVELDGPEDRDGSLREALRRAGWRAAPPVQPASTRLLDLRADEGVLWGDLRKKWRQYVNRARSGGVVIREGGAERLGDYYRIIDETARRVGFIIRTEGAYRSMWDVLRPHGIVSLLFADAPDGTPLATLWLMRCGDRVVEPFGGMTAQGADSRANYLLKWESIRRAKAAGATSYDMWGLASPGIAHFKSGFGGREIRYIGAWDLVFDPVGHAAFESALRARVWLALRRHGARAGDAGGGD